MTLEVQIFYPRKRKLFRIPHDIEREQMYVVGGEKEDFRFRGNHFGSVRKAVYDHRAPLPEVYRLYPSHQIPLNKACQMLWRNINPELSNPRFATLFGNTLAWCNGTGSGQGNDYIMNNLGFDKDIAFDQPRLGGGAIVEGIVEGDAVKIKTVLTTQPLPSAQEVLDDATLWHWATSVNLQGEVNLITRVGLDARNHPVRIPNMTRLPVYLPLDEVQEVDDFKGATWVV